MNPPEPEDDPEEVKQRLKEDIEDYETIKAIVDHLSSLPAPKPDCICYTTIDADEPAKCVSCSGRLDPVRSLQIDRLNSLQRLVEVRWKLERARNREDAAAAQTSVFTARFEELEDLMDAKAEEYIRLEKDLQVMKEKVSDEIEKRTELQISKDALQAELDELSKSLMEEANNLKIHEERKREMHESREKALMQELTEAKTQLQMEQLRLRELKIKMEENRQDSEEATSTPFDSNASLNSNLSFSNARPVDPIDPVLLNEFKDFLSHAPTIKLNKLNTLGFMKNAYEDDITPCLRFGSNPRTSTKRLIDAIVQNSCFVEEMTMQQITAHTALLSQAAAADKANPSGDPKKKANANESTSTLPTQAIFQKTVLERISTWTSSSSSAAQSAIVPGGCSACGKIGPVKFQFKISELAEDQWCPICQQCRDRLVSVCEFYNFIRHIRQGLYSTRRHEDLYLEMLSLKRKMFFSRMGAAGHIKLERPFAKSRNLLRPDSQLLREFEAVMVP
ncbi:Guanine nucleotide exchange factor (GEF) which may activate RAB8A and RAB8B [Phlyctochytrium bullatum]|nr:Guanine nucleotide exchange factor (GEF) which may activate RAB8A and RAB8B [Phlyctochytrium bullatum]